MSLSESLSSPWKQSKALRSPNGKCSSPFIETVEAGPHSSLFLNTVCSGWYWVKWLNYLPNQAFFLRAEFYPS